MEELTAKQFVDKYGISALLHYFPKAIIKDGDKWIVKEDMIVGEYEGMKDNEKTVSPFEQDYKRYLEAKQIYQGDMSHKQLDDVFNRPSNKDTK